MTRKAHDMFPFPFQIKDWSNGLRLITVEADFPNIVSIYIVVNVGSRNEVEPGKSGFAHFFEHMMFRGSVNYTSEQQAEIFKEIGADRNAYTTNDYTAYHTTFSKEDLETVLELEADRFQRLRYTEEAFKTEARAVLGEYNKNSSNPINQIFEVMQNTAFQTHTYKHTTMGFLDDIRDMPNQFAYSQEFYRRFYRPEYTTIVIVGDIETTNAQKLVEKHWSSWERGSHEVQIPSEPPQEKPLRCHIPWPSPTEPWVVVAHKGLPFSTKENGMAALDVISTLGFSETSDLYQRLFLQERKISAMFPYFPDHTDPYLVFVAARVKKAEDMEYVETEIIRTFREFQSKAVDAQRLDQVKRNLKYRFALGLDSSEAIASTLSSFIARGRTPDVINELYRLYDGLTPEDLMKVARRTFQDRHRTTATLAHGEHTATQEASKTSRGEIDFGCKTVLRPSRSPLITFRFVWSVGAANDPPEKAGLAYLTTRFLARSSTRGRAYDEIVRDLFPIASTLDYQVDKEMIVLHGTTHRDNVETFYGIFREVLLEPGWNAQDLDRVKGNTRTFLDIELRRNNDEELGKEVLYNRIYADHPYGHHNAGTLSSVENLTMEDVRSFYRQHFTRANLVVGLAGDYEDALLARISTDLERLPEGSVSRVSLPAPAAIESNQITIVEKTTMATGLHIGFPIEVTRSHEDWPALWLIRSYLGEHRSENSHLYQRLREVRGLNYGDYAYIEYFPRGMFQFHPDPGLCRSSQIFQIWIRPVEHQNAQFALRAAHFELEKLLDEGMSQEAFDATRRYLSKFVNVLVKSQDRELGYALDSAHYETEEFTQYVKNGLANLTVDDINRVLRENLRADRMHIVVVTNDGNTFKQELLANEVVSPTYTADPGAAVREEDAIICARKIDVAPENIVILPIEQVFAG